MHARAHKESACKDMEFVRHRNYHTIAKASKVNPPCYLVKAMCVADISNFEELPTKGFRPKASTGIASMLMVWLTKSDNSIKLELSKNYTDDLVACV